MDKQPSDTKAYRKSLSRFGTGVCVVTYQSEDGPRGMTINSFTSVSLDPPLVLISVAHDTRSFTALVDAPFTVNVLSVGQIDLALTFAGKPRDDRPVVWSKRSATPRLDGCIAWFDCQPWQQYPAGDHSLFLGEVLEFDERPGEPLLFSGGAFHNLGSAITEAPRGKPVPTNLIAPWLAPAHRVHEYAD